MTNSITEDLLLEKIGKCKRAMNNMYWEFIRSRDNNILWHNLIKKFKNKFSNHTVHIVALLYKIYIKNIQLQNNILTPKPVPKSPPTPVPKSPPTQVPKSPPTPVPKSPPTQVPKSPPTPVPKSPPTQVPKSPPTQVPKSPLTQESSSQPLHLSKQNDTNIKSIQIKKKFTGACRHTPGSNYKEWKKSVCDWKDNRVDNKTFSEWKKQDNYDSKKYDSSCPWFKYIDINMD